MNLRLATISVLMGLSNLALGQARPPVSVSITTPTPVAKTGAAIRVDIIVTNASDSAVPLFETTDGHAEASNTVEVFDAEGKQLPWTGRRLRSISRKMPAVEAGKSVEDFIVLTNDFDLTSPGKYTVIVKHEMLDPEATRPEDRRYFINSNPLSITVTE